jgi:hypothetical protein
LTGRFYFRSPDTTAALTPSPPSGAAAPQASIAQLLQAELRRVGCITGPTDGTWGPDSRNAMAAFNWHAKTRFGIDVASADALDAVRSMKSRVCPLQCADGFRVQGDQCVEIPITAVRPEPGRGGEVPKPPGAAPPGGSQSIACDRFGCKPVPPRCRVERTFDDRFGAQEHIRCP